MMNKIPLLEKFAAQSLVYVDTGLSDGKELIFSKEKFAELIVRECVTIIKHGIDHTEYPHPNDVEKSMVEMKAQMWCCDAIKEHFGVE